MKNCELGKWNMFNWSIWFSFLSVLVKNSFKTLGSYRFFQSLKFQFLQLIENQPKHSSIKQSFNLNHSYTPIRSIIIIQFHTKKNQSLTCKTKLSNSRTQKTTSFPYLTKRLYRPKTSLRTLNYLQPHKMFYLHIEISQERSGPTIMIVEQ